MTPKTPSTTINHSAPRRRTRAAWLRPISRRNGSEARLVYPIYAALATQFELAPLPYARAKLRPSGPRATSSTAT